ncbi:MAG: hypothetical protein E6K66_06560 [Nitrospirae bacterium]|nr:MAG: hypothetical protein E6K66_06560 [Nitrospirota bacterium]
MDLDSIWIRAWAQSSRLCSAHYNVYTAAISCVCGSGILSGEERARLYDAAKPHLNPVFLTAYQI